MRSAIFTLWIVLTLVAAPYFSEHYLLLVWRYGFFSVRREALHFTYLPSSHSMEDYVVSNGDHFAKTDGFIALPMAILVTAISVAVGYGLIMKSIRLKDVQEEKR